MAPTPMATDSQREPSPSALPALGAIHATSASNGTISRSSNSRIETIFCPDGSAMSPRSASSCITTAVEVSTKPVAPMKATCQGKPNSLAMLVSTSAQVTICSVPSPKISLRRLHRCEGRISRPITNRNITTPSSAVCRIACGSENQPSPNGPIARPAAK